ncbi:MAG TPA: type II toxin-antitoxin system PemK/MazF family toxin [Cellulomonas sp.]
MPHLDLSALTTAAGWFADHPWAGVLVVALLVGPVGSAVRTRRRGTRRGPTARPGEVWFALVPFEERRGAKDRPVLVLAVHGRTCTVARMTSQDQDTRRDHARVPPGMTGLRRQSWISLRPQELRTSALRRRVSVPGEALVAWHRDRAHRR